MENQKTYDLIAFMFGESDYIGLIIDTNAYNFFRFVYKKKKNTVCHFLTFCAGLLLRIFPNRKSQLGLHKLEPDFFFSFVPVLMKPHLKFIQALGASLL